MRDLAHEAQSSGLRFAVLSHVDGKTPTLLLPGLVWGQLSALGAAEPAGKRPSFPKSSPFCHEPHTLGCTPPSHPLQGERSLGRLRGAGQSLEASAGIPPPAPFIYLAG